MNLKQFIKEKALQITTKDYTGLPPECRYEDIYDALESVAITACVKSIPISASLVYFSL